MSDATETTTSMWIKRWTRNALGIAVIIHVVGLIVAGSIVALRSMNKQDVDFKAAAGP